MRLLILVAAAVALTACSTTSPAVRLANNQASCSAYGFQPNTEAYANCMMQLDIKERQADLEHRRRIGDAISDMGDRPPPAQISPRPPIFPNQTTTVCESHRTGFGTGYGTGFQTICRDR